MSDDDHNTTAPLLTTQDEEEPRSRNTTTELRAAAQRALASPYKHWLILTLVVLDVAGILGDIFIGLITCEIGRSDEPWVRPTRDALASFSLVMSCLFMAELLLSLAAEPGGPRAYLADKFRCFDAFVIAVGFAVDLLEHGAVEEIASLVIVLRLWRCVKIVEELSVVEGADRGDEALRARVEELEKRNRSLEEQLFWQQERPAVA